MGQVALGIRSLAVRLAVFVILAALLAWILGGTLFPAPHRVNLESWDFDGSKWHWRVTGSSGDPAPAQWSLFEQRGSVPLREERFGLAGVWRSIHGPQWDGATMVLGIEVEPSPHPAGGLNQWWSIRVDPSPQRQVERVRAEDERSLLERMNGHDTRPH